MAEEKKRDSNEEHPQNTPVEIRLARYTGWLVIVTAGLFIVTAFLAYFGFRQVQITIDAVTEQAHFARATLDSTHSQLEIARTTMTAELRAYLCISFDRSKTDENQGAPIFQIINSGLTPAYRVSYWLNYRFADVTSHEPFQEKPLVPQRTTFFTIASRDTYLVVVPKIGNFEEFRNGLKASYYWGVVQYEDVFGHHHSTHFRFVCSVQGNKIFWQLSPDGNQAD